MLLKKVKYIFNWVINGCAMVATVLIWIACIIVCVEIVARYFLNRPQAWVLETTEYFLLWLTFLGATWVLKKEGHVKIDIVIKYLNPKYQALVNAITSLIAATICFVVFWYGLQVSWDYYQRGVIIPKTLQPLKSPILIIIPVGSFLLSIQFLIRAYNYLKIWQTSKIEQ